VDLQAETSFVNSSLQASNAVKFETLLQCPLQDIPETLRTSSGHSELQSALMLLLLFLI